MKRKLIAAIMAAAMCLTFAAAFVGCDMQDEKPRAYVSLDINPSVSLILAEDGSVESAVAENEDAQVLLIDLTLEGKSLEDAVGIVAQAAVDCGFLSADNSVVDVTVATEDDSVEYRSTILGEIDRAFSAAVEGDAFTVELNSEGSYTLNRMLEYYKSKYPDNAQVQAMTPAKLDLVLSVTEKDGSLSFEAAADLDISSLITMAETTYAEIEPYMTAAYEAAVAEAQLIYENAKAVARSSVWGVKYSEFMLKDFDIPGLLTENHGIAYAAYDSLAIILDYALDKAVQLQGYADAALAQVDVAALAEMLGAEQSEVEAAIVGEDGKITLGSIDAFVDRTIKNMSDEAQAQWDDSELKTYLNELQDEAEAQVAKLPEEYANLINAAVEALEFTGVQIGELVDALGSLTMEDMRAAVDKLIEKRDAEMAQIQADLTADEIAEIEAAVADLDDALAAAEAQLNSVTEQAKAQAVEALRELKAQLLA